MVDYLTLVHVATSYSLNLGGTLLQIRQIEYELCSKYCEVKFSVVKRAVPSNFSLTGLGLNDDASEFRR